MKIRTLAVCLLFAGVCSAKEHDYFKGILVRMDSSSCGTQEKGSALLPIGGTARFRISKGKLLLRAPEVNDKEREYIVVSMTPRERDVASASASKN